MKSLGEIYWDIDHQCREENITMSDESMMLFHAAEGYVEELLRHDRWKFIIKSDIESLKVSSFIRREIKGYSHGAEVLLLYIIHEIERFGYSINDIINPITLELTQKADADNSMIQGTTQNETIPETGNNECPNTGENSGNKGKSKPMTRDEIIQSLEGKEVFEPLKPINLYGVYYDRLVKGKITDEDGESKVLGIIRKVCDDDKDNIELFKHCVEKADISNLYNVGRRTYARLFMNDIASLFCDPEKYRKAAHDSFGLKEGTELSAAGGTYKKDYRLLMKGLFLDDADYRKKNQ